MYQMVFSLSLDHQSFVNAIAVRRFSFPHIQSMTFTHFLEPKDCILLFSMRMRKAIWTRTRMRTTRWSLSIADYSLAFVSLIAHADCRLYSNLCLSHCSSDISPVADYSPAFLSLSQFFWHIRLQTIVHPFFLPLSPCGTSGCRL